MDDYIPYVVELKKAKKSVCLSVRPSVHLFHGHNNFWRSLRIETKFGGCLLHIKYSSAIEIQIKILTLILIRI